MTVQLVGWALIHSLWQGAVIVALLGITLSMLRKSPAAWRHIACLIALVAMPVAPLMTSIRTVDDATVTSAAPPANTPSVQNANPQPTPSSAEPAPVKGTLGAETSAPASNARFDVERVLPWLVTFWLFGVVLLSLRVIGGYVRARRLVRFGTKAVSAEIAAMAHRVAERLRVAKAVRVLESASAQVPMVIGMLRPVVLLPASLLTGLTVQQVEAILAHELAHVRRYDYAVNLVQTVLETLFFYHPAMWWLSRRLRDEREQACDELAVSICGNDPIFYSRVLLTVEEWRSERISFAPAATGGSLALRIRKLIGEDERRLDVGPRWFAGIVTVATALVATGSVVSDNADAQSLKVMTEAHTTQDTARARPASVHKYVGTGSVDARWSWATETARQKRFDRYWVGYVVSGVSARDWLYHDRGSAVQAGDSWFSGHMRFSGEFDNLKFSGVSLTTLVGDYSPNDYAVFLAFDATSRRPRLVRVRLANFIFPMHFNRWPVLWLDEVSGDESVRVLAGLQDEAVSTEVMSDLPSAIGAHQNSGVVVPILLGWLNDGGKPHEFRVEAIEALGYHGAPEALAAVSRIARSGEDEDLRAEAVETLGDMPLSAAADTLMSLARTLTSERLRAEAVESLGDRPEPHVVEFLEQAARAENSTIRNEAIEALADLPDQRGVAVIARLAEDATVQADTRREAVESLADTKEQGRALETLRRIIFNDASTAVQIEAAEALGDMDDEGAVALLVDVVEKHPAVPVQIEATEALGDAHSRAAALAALERIARTHPQRSVRIAAIESIGNFSDDGAGAAALIRFLRTRPEEGVAIEAIEALADAGDPARVAEYLQEVLESDAGLRMKIEVLEVLAELPYDAGLALLERYTRSPDVSMRAKAAELIAERKN